MTALYIILVIIAFIILLMFIPLRLRITVEGGFEIKVKYGVITLYDSKKPKPEKKKSGKDKKVKTTTAKEEKKDGFVKSTFKEKGFFDGISYFAHLLKTLLYAVKDILKKCKIKRFETEITVASENAAKTAICYGVVCTAVYPLIEFIDTLSNLEIKRVDIHTDFDHVTPDLFLNTEIRICPLFLIKTAIILIKEYKKIKDGENNERK